MDKNDINLIFKNKIETLKLYIQLGCTELSKIHYKECFKYFQENSELSTNYINVLDELKEKIEKLQIEQKK